MVPTKTPGTQSNNTVMTENELATIAVDIAFKIHTALGPGLLESVYESAFACELEKRGIKYTRQQDIPASYEDVVLDVGFRADIIMENKLLIELKSIEHIDKVHHKVVLTYLKLSGLKLGLLINFGVNLIKDGIHRKINGQLT
ncbi:MAG TPA: GxxExxY protein [Chitinophagaceae bacterium]|nr:GxxExxY protein [Chitinophagaceae bacterium]